MTIDELFFKNIEGILDNYVNDILDFVPDYAVTKLPDDTYEELENTKIGKYCLGNNIPIASDVIINDTISNSITYVYHFWLLKEKDCFELLLRGLTSEHQIRKVTVKHGGNNV